MLTAGVIFCTMSSIMYVRSAVTEEGTWAECPPRMKPLTLAGETNQIINMEFIIPLLSWSVCLSWKRISGHKVFQKSEFLKNKEKRE